jgi:hypothetical protein
MTRSAMRDFGDDCRLNKSVVYPELPVVSRLVAPAIAGDTDRPFKLPSKRKSHLPYYFISAKLGRMPVNASPLTFGLIGSHLDH